MVYTPITSTFNAHHDQSVTMQPHNLIPHNIVGCIQLQYNTFVTTMRQGHSQQKPQNKTNMGTTCGKSTVHSTSIQTVLLV